MSIFIGLFAIAKDGCARRYQAIPPPPYYPPYTLEEALRRFYASPCGRALGKYEVTEANLWGVQPYDAKTRTTVGLHLTVTSPPSRLGVRYQTDTGDTLDPKTGELEDAEDCARIVAARVRNVDEAIAEAEASPEVQAFIALHSPPEQIWARYDPSFGDHGGITYAVRRPDGHDEVFEWKRK